MFSRRPSERRLLWPIMAVFVLLSIKAVQQISSRASLAVPPLNELDNNLSETFHGSHQHLFSWDANLHTNGMAIPWSSSYSPLDHNGACKPLASVVNDLKQIENLGIPRVRLASLDCQVLNALKQSPKLNAILGIYVDGSSHNAHYVDDEDHEDPKYQGNKVVGYLKAIYVQLKELIDSGINIDGRIDMLVVGTDSGIYNGVYSRYELVKMLKFVRLSLPDYTGYVTIAEPVESYISGTRFNAVSAETYHAFNDDEDLCGSVDSIGLVSQPYFNSAIEASQAGVLLQRDVRFAKHLCSESFIGSAHRDGQALPTPSDSPESPVSKHVAVLEAGWPSAGTENGNAVASVEEQQVAIEELIQARDLATDAYIPVNIHSFSDELWRDPGSLNVESSFGISHLFN